MDHPPLLSAAEVVVWWHRRRDHFNAATEIREMFAAFEMQEVALNYSVSGKPTPARELIISTA